jgi:hypothetical protein
LLEPPLVALIADGSRSAEIEKVEMAILDGRDLPKNHLRS